MLKSAKLSVAALAAALSGATMLVSFQNCGNQVAFESSQLAGPSLNASGGSTTGSTNGGDTANVDATAGSTGSTDSTGMTASTGTTGTTGMTASTGTTGTTGMTTSTGSTGTVCIPDQLGTTGGGSTTGATSLTAELYAKPGVTNMSQVTDLASIIKPEYRVKNAAGDSVIMPLRNISVTPQTYTKGFVDGSGNRLVDSAGVPFVEYFGLSITGEIKLPAGFSAGNYQFATLTDDGSKVWLSYKNTQNLPPYLINADGQHSPKLKVLTTPLAIAATDRLTFKMDWFQGPRDHIATVLLWRKLAPGASTSEPLDEVASTNLWFNTDTDQPGVHWNAILGRGWTIVPPEAFIADTSPGVTPVPCP